MARAAEHGFLRRYTRARRERSNLPALRRTCVFVVVEKTRDIGILKALGASGRVVGIADPTALAGAALELLGDPAAWRKAQQAGIARVEKYYTQERMFNSYRELYANALAKGGAA